MDPLSGIGGNLPANAIGAANALDGRVLAADLAPLSPGLFGGPSAVVQTSGVAQLLSSVSMFQDQMAQLQGDLAAGGANAASLATAAQTLVTAFNTLQSSLAGAATTGFEPGAAVVGGADLAQALDSQAQATFAAGGPSTQLAQIGITYQPDQAGNAATLTLDQNALQSAISSNPAGVGSLLAAAADSMAALAGNFVAQVSGQFAGFATLLDNIGQTTGLFDGGAGLINLLALESLTQNGSAGANVFDVLTALSNYLTVAQLLA